MLLSLQIKRICSQASLPSSVIMQRLSRTVQSIPVMTVCMEVRYRSECLAAPGTCFSRISVLRGQAFGRMFRKGACFPEVRLAAVSTRS